jgi:MoxR-like ATPase
MQDDRLISSSLQEEDAKNEYSIRPHFLSEYIGQESVKEHMQIYIEAAKSRGESLDHALLYGPPGLGKTTLAVSVSEAMSLSYKRVQFTPDVMPSDITGFSMFNPQSREFEYHQGAAMCNLLLADEINRTSPKTQSALLEIMIKTRWVNGVVFQKPLFGAALNLAFNKKMLGNQFPYCIIVVGNSVGEVIHLK